MAKQTCIVLVFLVLLGIHMPAQQFPPGFVDPAPLLAAAIKEIGEADVGRAFSPQPPFRRLFRSLQPRLPGIDSMCYRNAWEQFSIAAWAPDSAYSDC